MIIKNDAEIRLKVTTDSKDSEKGIDNLNNKAKDTPNHLNKIGDIGKKVFKATAVAVGTATVALGGLVMKSVQMAGELEQQLGGSEAVFKELGNSIDQMSMKIETYNSATGKMEKSMSNLQDVSLNAYKNMGLSQNEYLATLNKMGSLMQGAGLDTEKSLNLSAQAMQRAADVASVMGIDVNMAMESIAGAAKGNFTMMDNLGVAMNDTTLQAYAMEKGINKSTQAMTNAEKVELAMQMFLEKTQKMAGNYARENETFAGSFQTLKASVQNFLSGATDIEPVIDSLMSFGNILVKSIGEMAPKIVDGIIGLINGIVPMLPGLLEKLLPSVITGAVNLITGLVNSLPTLIPVLMNGIIQAFTQLSAVLPQLLKTLIRGALTLVQSLAQQLPTLIPVVIKAILDMIPILLQNLPLFIQAGTQLELGLIEGLINAIPILVDSLPEIVEALIEGFMEAIPLILMKAPQIILALATGLIKAIPKLVAKLPQIVNAIVTGISNGIGKMGNVGGDLMKGLWNGISGLKNWVISKVKNMGKSIIDGLKGVLGIHSPSKEFAIIGRYSVEGYEEGLDDMQSNLDKRLDNLVNLDGLDYLQNGFANISANYGSIALPSNINNNVTNISINAEMDTDKFGRAFVREIKTFGGGSKPDYNVGGGR